MIIADQLRAPRWLPPGGQSAVDTVLPNIAQLRTHSFIFPNYFVAATNCSPSRSTLLTGLYTQQTCVFTTVRGVSTDVPLLTGFPTFGTVLSQSLLGYDTAWIGKWHLGGSDGPSSGYGFTNGNNFPNSSDPSPDGYPNEGTDGNGSSSANEPSPSTTVSGLTAPFSNTDYDKGANDAAIYDWFTDEWWSALPDAPWCLTVSFVNPHDISDFPYTFALAGTGTFGSPVSGHSPTVGFQPPNSMGVASSNLNLFIPPLPDLYDSSNTPPSSWNESDQPTAYDGGTGKPDVQAYFQDSVNNAFGAVTEYDDWLTFLNYYFWMQQCVDDQIGRLLGTLQSNSTVWGSTVIIFTSDHGEYAGSHGLHGKGGGVYDESINVPLYISFPSQRMNWSTGTNYSPRYYVCSSVDILPFLYELALGNGSWRSDTSDLVYYLRGRESIMDAIFHGSSATQRRVAPDPINLPYVISTTDENGNLDGIPAHAIAFRTVDNSSGPPFGGAKLGIYTNWADCSTKPDAGTPQYEYYDYTGGNRGEIGNEAFDSGVMTTTASDYLTAFDSISCDELYDISFAGSTALQSVYADAFQAYMDTLSQSCSVPASCS